MNLLKKIGNVVGIVTLSTVVAGGFPYLIGSCTHETFNIAKWDEVKKRRNEKRELVDRTLRKAAGADRAFSFEEQLDLARKLGYDGGLVEGKPLQLKYREMENDFILNVYTFEGWDSMKVSEERIRNYVNN